MPITTPERTLLDLAATTPRAPLARALREAVRLQRTTIDATMAHVLQHRRRRGASKLALACSSYSGLPLARARSGAEVRALVVLRDAGRAMPELNRRIAGEEADLSWPRHRVIIELDGRPFHLDQGEAARKQRLWEDAGWTVRRLDTDIAFRNPGRLLALAPHDDERP